MFNMYVAGQKLGGTVFRLSRLYGKGAYAGRQGLRLD